MDALFALASTDRAFDLFGADAIQCFYDAATVTGAPVRAPALMYVAALGSRWRSLRHTHGWMRGAAPTVAEILEAIIGAYCAERLGMVAEFKENVIKWHRLACAAFERAGSALHAPTARVRVRPTAAGAAMNAEMEGANSSDTAVSEADADSDFDAAPARRAGADSRASRGQGRRPRGARKQTGVTEVGEARKPTAAEVEVPSTAMPAHEAAPFVLTELTPFTATDFFGWDPRACAPPMRTVQPEVCHECGMPNARHIRACTYCRAPLALLSPYRLMSNGLVHAFYGDRIGCGFSLGGATYADVLQWLPRFRPYRSYRNMPERPFLDQCYLVTHVILTLSNWGKLRLRPSLLPHEFYFLRENLPYHMRRGDPHLVAESLTCLRVFGCDDTDELVLEAMRHLLSTQGSDGYWDAPRGDDGQLLDPYLTYHATMVAAEALVVHQHRGFGPGNPAVLPMLQQWLADEEEAAATAAEPDTRNGGVEASAGVKRPVAAASGRASRAEAASAESLDSIPPPAATERPTMIDAAASAT